MFAENAKREADQQEAITQDDEEMGVQGGAGQDEDGDASRPGKRKRKMGAEEAGGSRGLLKVNDLLQMK